MNDQHEELLRWLWDYISLRYQCNPLSVSSGEALKIVARCAWDNPGSAVEVWYKQASESDREAFQQAWYDLCSSLR